MTIWDTLSVIVEVILMDTAFYKRYTPWGPSTTLSESVSRTYLPYVAYPLLNACVGFDF